MSLDKRRLIFISNFLYFFILLSLASCSFIEKTRRHFLGDSRPKRDSSEKNNNFHQREALPENQVPVQIGSPVEGQNNTVSVEPTMTTQDQQPIAVNQLPKTELADPNSVWVFDTMVSGGGAGKDLDILQKALQLYSSKQWDASMGQLRQIVQSNNDQVQVRARFYAGKILQYKNKHNLALQVFEQIIEQNGYSSLAMLALKEATFSAKEAQLKDKELFYQTSLDDLIKQAQVP